MSKIDCFVCQRAFVGTKIEEHLKLCLAKALAPQASDEKVNYHLIKASTKHFKKNYVLYIKVVSDVSLSVLDDSLREVWLECCNHLSAFEKDGPSKRYVRDDELQPGEESMEDIKVSDFFGSGSKHRHVYDFGTRTVLDLALVTEGVQPKNKRLTASVAQQSSASSSTSPSQTTIASPLSSSSDGRIEKESRALIANTFIAGRNQPQKFLTSSKEVATHFCQECQSFLSETELEEDEDGCCGKECLRRICNSPRWGICGYGE